MSMPIQRQSDQFSIFDDGPRYARDRQSVELPRGLAGLINTTGPRITGGLLNTRQATITASCDYCGKEGHDWQIHPEAHADVAEWEREKNRLEFPFGDYHEAARLAVNTDGMDPDSHAYHTELPWGPGGEWVGDEDGHRSPRREWNPDFGYEPTAEDERRAEGVYDDDESGYNWGPEPHPEDEDGPGPSPDFHDGSPLPFDTPIYNPRSAPYDNITGSRLPFELTAACQTCGGGVYHISGEGFVHDDTEDQNGWDIDEDHEAEPDQEDEQHLGLESLEAWNEQQHLASREDRDVDLDPGYARDLENLKKWPAESWDEPIPLSDMEMREMYRVGPGYGRTGAAAPAPVVPGAHSYQPAHRVGLPWRDQVIPGTVIGLNGPNVAVRWDDGQYSSEEPHNIHLL